MHLYIEPFAEAMGVVSNSTSPAKIVEYNLTSHLTYIIYTRSLKWVRQQVHNYTVLCKKKIKLSRVATE